MKLRSKLLACLSLTAAPLLLAHQGQLSAAEASHIFATDTLPTVKIGYSSSTQSTLTGAVDKVTQERMNKGLVTSSLDALSGQAAGVQVTGGGNQEAMVSAVRVRGTTSLTGGNDPLVIIDGVASDLSTLSTIYPADIESFTILKDASETAQYGSRGAAGVIMVATKKGKQQQFHISYDGTVGFESAYKHMQMLSGPQFRQAAQRLGVPYIEGGSDTDFHNSIVRTGFVQNHHVAFGGGNELANYRASVGMMEHNTVVKTNDYKNYIAKLDISQQAFDNRLKVDLGIFGSLQRSAMLPFKQKLFFSADAFNPTLPDGTDSQGNYPGVTEALWASNPNALLQMKQDEDNAHFNVHMNAQAQLTKELALRVFGSYSYNSVDNAHFYPTFVWSHGEAYRSNSKSEELFGNIALDYSWACADREWQTNYANTIQAFFYSKGIDDFADQYNVDGTEVEFAMPAGMGEFRGQGTRHSVGLVSTLAAATLAADHEIAREFVQRLWDSENKPYEDGYFDAYYDGILRLFAFMHLSGHYRVITPTE